MIQGYITAVVRDQNRAIVRTEYGDLIAFRILDGTPVDVGDAIVGSLDQQGETFILDHSKHAGVLVYLENGRRLFALAGRRSQGRHTLASGRYVPS